MKRTCMLLAAAGALLLAGCAGIHDKGDRIDLWGTPTTAAAATKIVVITADTKFLNLVGGDVVRFVVGEQSFTWSFDGIYFPAAVDISKISNGLLQRPVMAYVERNPMYQMDR